MNDYRRQQTSICAHLGKLGPDLEDGELGEKVLLQLPHQVCNSSQVTYENDAGLVTESILLLLPRFALLSPNSLIHITSLMIQREKLERMKEFGRIVRTCNTAQVIRHPPICVVDLSIRIGIYK